MIRRKLMMRMKLVLSLKTPMRLDPTQIVS